MVRVNKVVNLPEDRGYKLCVLNSKAGLAIKIKALHFLITYVAACRADIVVGKGLGRVKSKFCYFLVYCFPFFGLS